MNLEELDPVEILELYIEINKIKKVELERCIGKTTTYFILKRRRVLNLRMIRELHDRFDIPLELLIQEY